MMMPTVSCAACNTSSDETEYQQAGHAWMCVRCVNDYAFVGSSIDAACKATGMTHTQITDWARASVWPTYRKKV